MTERHTADVCDRLVVQGNAARDTGPTRGWLLGWFVPEGDARSTTAVEVKWGVHVAGESRPGWTVGDARSTLVLLVTGRFRVEHSGGSVVLGRQGDYVLWGPGVDHWWQAVTDSVVVTVRWPSRPDESS